MEICYFIFPGSFTLLHFTKSGLHKVFANKQFWENTFAWLSFLTPSALIMLVWPAWGKKAGARKLLLLLLLLKLGDKNLENVKISCRLISPRVWLRSTYPSLLPCLSSFSYADGVLSWISPTLSISSSFIKNTKNAKQFKLFRKR